VSWDERLRDVSLDELTVVDNTATLKTTDLIG
jgi:hypothetical protein